LWDAPLTRTPDLVESYFWLGLELNRIRHSGLLSPLAVFDPRLRQVQTIRYRHTRLLRGHRNADRDSAVILLADLAAILPGHSYRLAPFLRKPSVIYHPCDHRFTAQHCGKHKIQAAIQHRFVAPRDVCDQVMTRLVHPTHVVCCKACGHGFDALPFAGQQQAGAVVLQRSMAINVPCGVGQPSIYAAKRFSCGPGAVSLPTEQFYTKLFVSNTVVLVQ
jgi:hypothetical protein